MLFRGVDGSGDWIFGQGKQSYFTENAAIRADISTSIKTFFQECFYDPNFGVPWFSILGQKNKDLFIMTIKNKILEVDGVTRVVDLTYDLNADREARVTYSVNTIYTVQLIGEVLLQ